MPQLEKRTLCHEQKKYETPFSAAPSASFFLYSSFFTFCIINLYVAGICEDMEESANTLQPVVDVLIVGAGTKNSHPSNVRPSLAYDHSPSK